MLLVQSPAVWGDFLGVYRGVHGLSFKSQVTLLSQKNLTHSLLHWCSQCSSEDGKKTPTTEDVSSVAMVMESFPLEVCPTTECAYRILCMHHSVVGSAYVHHSPRSLNHQGKGAAPIINQNGYCNNTYPHSIIPPHTPHPLPSFHRGGYDTPLAPPSVCSLASFCCTLVSCCSYCCYNNLRQIAIVFIFMGKFLL